jgi:hypothetical protein
MDKWEYFKYYSPELPSAEELNDYGGDGWELVQIVQGKTLNLTGFFAYLKRPLDLSFKSDFNETIRRSEEAVRGKIKEPAE